MRKAAECFSKFMFWVENTVYIIGFLIYEFLMFPIVYFKIFLSLFFMAGITKFIPFSLFWLFIGPFIIMGFIAKDMFFYIKILCDYQDEEDQFKEKEEEDFK